MASLPAIDLGLMAEHLAAHEGIINKLELYQTKVINASLKEIISLQINVMREHARVMLALINPHQNEYVKLKPLNEHVRHYNLQAEDHRTKQMDKWIALEAQDTAKSMSNENYASALMMQNQHVSTIHVQMALQQLEIKNKYSELIEKMGWVFTPFAHIH